MLSTNAKVEESLLALLDVDGEGWISRAATCHLLCCPAAGPESLLPDQFEQLLEKLPGDQDGRIRAVELARLIVLGLEPSVTEL